MHINIKTARFTFNIHEVAIFAYIRAVWREALRISKFEPPSIVNISSKNGLYFMIYTFSDRGDQRLQENIAHELLAQL